MVSRTGTPILRARYKALKKTVKFKSGAVSAVLPVLGHLVGRHAVVGATSRRRARSSTADVIEEPDRFGFLRSSFDIITYAEVRSYAADGGVLSL